MKVAYVFRVGLVEERVPDFRSEGWIPSPDEHHYLLMKKLRCKYA